MRVGQLVGRPRGRGEAVAAGEIDLVRLIGWRQADRRDSVEPAAAGHVEPGVVVDEAGAVVAGGELRLVARVADRRLVELRAIVDRIDEEVGALTAAEQAAAGLLLLARGEAHVPARVDPLVDAGREGLALGTELERVRRLAVDCLRGAVEAGEAGDRRVGAVARRLAEVDEVTPVALPALLESELAVL